MKQELNYLISKAISQSIILYPEVSKYGVISGPYFPVLGLNTDQK